MDWDWLGLVRMDWDGLGWIGIDDKNIILKTNNDILLSTAYLPPVQWFSKLVANRLVYIEYNESYHKQTYRNRCVIDSPNGKINLTVPVEKPANGSRLIRDIRISDHDDWRIKHWHSLESSYFNSPFFEFYQDDFRPFFETKYEFLVDFNEALILKCQELIGMNCELAHTDNFVAPEDAEAFSIRDYRQVISPKMALDLDSEFKVKPYYQVFDQGTGFKPNLSIVDLIFNMGPEAKLLLF